jgi:hypothetical protein
MMAPVPPPLSAPPELHADWIEWLTLTSGGRFASWSAHQRTLRIGGIDESEDVDVEDASEDLIQSVEAELCERQQACGVSGAYPFEILEQGLELRSQTNADVYRFMLLLTLLGHEAGPPGTHGDRIFEDLCAAAFHAYLGAPAEGVQLVPFGFPRRVEPSGFAAAVNSLCRKLGEGIRCRKEPETSDQNDAKLDLVAWRAFPDRKTGQLIAFGNCATGENWFERKLHELQPAEWCRLWMQEMPSVHPVKALFVPRRVEQLQWRRATVYGGIVFDRCRITWLLPELPIALSLAVEEWLEFAIQSHSTP